MRYILIFLISLLCASSVQVTSVKKYMKENITIFEDTYSYGIWDVHFDEDLYTYQAFGSNDCFVNATCRPSSIPCDPCDWTDPLICSGQIRGPGSSCPCVTLTQPAPLMCFPERYPLDSTIWPKGDDVIIINNTHGTFDVMFHPAPPNNCSCILFKYDMIEGEIQGLLLFFGETWVGTNNGVYVLSRHGIATVCPSNPRWGQSHVARLVGDTIRSPYVVIKLSLQYVDIPTTVYDHTCTIPSEYSTTHRCVASNTFTTLMAMPGQGFIRVVVDPSNRCGVLGFWASSLEHLISTNPWVSLENSTNTHRTHRIGVVDGRLYPSMYPYCLQPGERLFVYVITTTLVDFFVDTNREWMISRPLTDFPPADYYKRLLGAVTAYCPTGNYTAHRSVYPVSENMETGSLNLRAVYPSDDVDVMYPPPLTANDEYRFARNIPVLPAESKRLIISLLLSHNLVPRLQPVVWRQPWFSNNYHWMTTKQWSDCSLRISEIITDSRGNGLGITISVDDAMINKFNPSTYSELSAEINNLQGEISTRIMDHDLALDDMYTLWLQQNRIASSDTMYAAKEYIRSFTHVKPLKETVRTNQCVSNPSSNDFIDDPCCQLNDTSLYQECVMATRSLGNQYEIAAYTENIVSCPIQECARSSLTNLQLEQNINFNPTACTSLVDRPVDQSVYWKCIETIWGPEPVSFAGPSCTHDIDCPSSRCNVYSKRCSVDIVTAEKAFISCLYNGLSQFSRTSISNELELTSTDSNSTIALWLTGFSELLPCSDPYTPVGSEIKFSVYSRCYGCSLSVNSTIAYWASSPGTSWANFGRDCWAPLSSTCTITPFVYAPKAYCAILGCTSVPYKSHPFLPYSLAPSTCSNATYCGVSDDGFYYNDVTSIIPLASCDNSILCTLANGTQLRTTTTNECGSILSCDVSGVSNQGQCENSGVCSDSTDYDVGIWKGFYTYDTSGCFFTIRYKAPFNPTVKVCEPPFRDTIIGCSVVPSVMAINKTTCEASQFFWGDPTIFELINPRWVTKATTEDECLSYGKVCDNPLNPQPAGINSHTNTLSFGECTGITRYLFTWRRGRWLPGQVRYTNVTTGRLAQRFSSAPRVGLNLPNILSNLTKAVSNLQLLKAQSSAFCRDGYRKYLDELICSCNAKQNDTTCYNDKNNVTGIGVVCDEVGEFSVGDYNVKTQSESLPPSTCDSLYISVSSITLYLSRTITPLKTLLVNYNEDTEFAIRNEKLGIYGKVLTSGYAADFNVPISNITLCIKLSPLRANYRSRKYSVFDVAMRPSKSHPDDLIPLYVNVNVTDDVFCANISSLEDNTLYYFIQRVSQDYTVVERTVFDTGETAYISVLLALYCCGLTFAIIRFCMVLQTTISDGVEATFASVRLACVLFLIISFFIFRVILFSLLLNNSLLGSSSTRAISYLLFEFPIVIFFSFVTNYVCIWLTLAQYAKDILGDFRKQIKLANLFSIVLNLIIFGLFILMIILFETIIFEPYLTCGGAVMLYDSDQNRALILSYRIIFSSIAIMIGLGILIVASRAGQYLGKKKFGMTWKFRFRMYSISIIGGLGFIGQAIYFLIITIQDATPNNYASLTILLCLELLPALAFTFIDQLPKPRAGSSGGSTGKSTPRGSTDKRTANNGVSVVSIGSSTK